MDKKLQGKFMGCPYHDDDYEACIEYSGRAPCDPPECWQLVPVVIAPTSRRAGQHALENGCYIDGIYADMLAAAPKWGGG